MTCRSEISAIALAALFLSSSLAFGEIPRFVVEPESVVAKAGSSVHLSCSVQQNSTEVTWLLNGSVVTAQRPRDIRLRDGMLVISAFSEAEHAGVYRCLVSGPFGSVVSREASVESAVLYSTDASETVAEIAVVKGNAAVVPCYPPFSRPQADIEFELNGTRLILGGRHLILPSGNLQISNVSHGDGGSYRCSAFNRVLSKRLLASVVQRLTVVSPLSNVTPSFIWSSRDFVTVVLGQNLTLECAAEGWPVPELTWEKYGGHLPTGRFSYLLGNLVIERVQRFDAGTYLCRASNGIGQPQAKVVSVEILERPVIETPPVGQNVTQGNTAQLVCGARGAPKVSTQWLHNAKPMPTTDQFITVKDSTLILSNVQPSQSGVYQCVVKNGLGVDHAATTLTVIESMGTTTVEDDDDDDDDDSAERLRPDRKPEDGEGGGEHFRHRGHLVAPSKPEVVKLSNSSVHVQWTVEAPSGGHVITGFKVQWKEVVDEGGPGLWRTAAEEVPAPRRTHRLQRLRPGGVYRFRVGSVFSNGESKYGRSSNRIAMTAPAPGPGPGPGAVEPHPMPPSAAAAPPSPLIVELRPLSSSEIFIGWQQLESDQWPIDGFYIFYLPQGESSEYQKKVVKGTSVRHAVLSHLSPGTSYQIRMQAFSSIAGDSRFSDTLLKDTMTGHSGDSLPSDYGAGGSGRSFAIHSKDFPLEDNSNEGRKKEGDDDATPIDNEWTAANASATTEGQLLYVALGVVFGLVALVTVVCIVVCMVKQHRQQQQRMSSAKEAVKPQATVFVDTTTLRPRASGGGGGGAGASTDSQVHAVGSIGSTKDNGHGCNGSCGGTGSNERSSTRTECVASLAGRPHERKVLLPPELLLPPPPPPLSNNSTPKKYSSCHGDKDSDVSLVCPRDPINCSNHTYSKLHGCPDSSSRSSMASSSDRQPSKHRATAVVGYGSCGRGTQPPPLADHIPRSYEHQQQQQQQQPYIDHHHMQRSQGSAAGGRPSPHHRLPHGQHHQLSLKSGHHGNQGWRRDEIPIEEENSMRDQSTNTDLLIGRDAALLRVYSDDDDDDGVYSSVGGGGACASVPGGAFVAQPRSFVRDDDLGFALRSGVCYQGNGYHGSGGAMGGDHLDSRCDVGHQARLPGRPRHTTTADDDDDTGHVTTDYLAMQQQQQRMLHPYLGYRVGGGGDVGYQ